MLINKQLPKHNFSLFFFGQALDVIPMLKEAMPLERAQMRLRVVISGKEARKVREQLVKLASKVECEDWESGTLNFVSTIL